MSSKRKPRVSIGVNMPGWLPRRMHAPARLALGLAIGAGIGLYSIALAVSVLKIWAGPGLPGAGHDPTLDIGNLVGLLTGAIVIRHALVRRGRRLEDL